MANDITSDDNCICLWRFESGSMLVDEQGNDDLTLSGEWAPPLEDTTVYHEGGCSAKFTDGLEYPYVIEDYNQSAEFPLKWDDGEGTKTTFSWVGWIYPTDYAGDRPIFGRMILNGNGDDMCVFIKSDTDTIGFIIWDDKVDSGIEIAYDAWNHIGITHDTETQTLTMRVYNESTGIADTYQTSMTGGHLVEVTNAPWAIGNYNEEGDLRVDEVAVFDDVLSVAEIDQIRAGTFGSGGGGGATGQAVLDDYTSLQLGCSF